MIKIKYYADDFERERHEREVELLNEIYERYGIEVGIVRVNPRHGSLPEFRGDVEEISKEKAWKRDFSGNRALSRNIGERPSKAFKTRSGYIVIAGAVGVVDGSLQWADKHGRAIKFLEKVLEKGESAIREVYVKEEKKEDLHERTAREFVEAGIISGRPKFGVTVGRLSEEEMEKYDRQWRDFAKRMVEKEIDLVIESDDKNWIVEIKREFTSDNIEKGLGQVFLYDYLYQIENPNKKTEKALAFAKLLNLQEQNLTMEKRKA